ncbi:Uncharacterised protein [Mycobacteroides abscessus subsp. abscessus]|uniref:hypothetical protein n=1 Tax=Mycobacteroides abscessus TaxID=36809 RepID=UPI0009291291|nr:hypothetical protein [Mycobacteroides abscessus]SHU65231.1 Uncharacterised protein [Mycobacteroides abscessus subsp. abscessus]
MSNPTSPLAGMPVVENFSDWKVPEGFTTVNIVKKFESPIYPAGQVLDGPHEFRLGVGHYAALPDGGALTVTPGGREQYDSAGYFLTEYDGRSHWIWGQQFDNVGSALTRAAAILQQQAQRQALTAKRH